MKKAILMLVIACFICACGQKGPLVPPESMISEGSMSGIKEILSS